MNICRAASNLHSSASVQRRVRTGGQEILKANNVLLKSYKNLLPLERSDLTLIVHRREMCALMCELLDRCNPDNVHPKVFEMADALQPARLYTEFKGDEP